MISTYTSKLKQLQIGDLIAKIPIIQGGMGVGISRCHLAGAVAKEGGKDVLKAMKNVKIKGKSVNVEPANAR